MKTNNPVIKEKAFQEVYQTSFGSEAMTINGTVQKTAFLLFAVLVGASITWSGGENALGLMFLGLIGGTITAFITIFKKHLSPYTAPLYAFLEGLFLGGLSLTFELSFPGIVQQAVLLTFGTLGAMLFAYRSGIIQVTNKFRLGVISATLGIAVTYFFALILSFFGIDVGIGLHGGMFGIIFSLIVVGVAALNLVLDFDFIEQTSHQNVPKYMEWYASFGLMITLVWLYMEILRLVAILNGRD